MDFQKWKEIPTTTNGKRTGLESKKEGGKMAFEERFKGSCLNYYTIKINNNNKKEEKKVIFAWIYFFERSSVVVIGTDIVY